MKGSFEQFRSLGAAQFVSMDRKTREKIAIMRVGGKKLAGVKQALIDHAVAGTPFEKLEEIAQAQIAKEGAVPSFSTVEGYSWATCISKNEGCCHGVPRNNTVEDGDVLKIDVGLIWQGYHVDTTATIFIGDTKNADPKVLQFIQDGWDILDLSIAKAVLGNSVYDVSHTMQTALEKKGYGAVYQLTGHAIGKTLHEDPQIPCVAYSSDKKVKFFEGQTICVEVMDAMGNPKLVLGKDGWTYQTKDGSLTGMFEDTIVITSGKPEILTR